MDAEKVGLASTLLSLLTVSVIEGTTRSVAPIAPLPPVGLVGVARLAEISLLLTIVLRFENGLSSLGMALCDMAWGIKMGLLWSAAFGGVVVVILTVAHYAGYPLIPYIDASLPGDTGEILLLFAVGAFVSPIAEELFFRGYVYGYVRRWGVLAAVILSTGVFVAAHSDIARIPVPQLVGGILFAVAYEWKGNLMVPITIHILGNSAIYALSLMF